MVSKVILHIGMHKTGSSSIQSSLMNYDDGSTFYARFPHENHSSGMYTAFSSHPMDYHAWRRVGHSKDQVANIRKSWREMLTRDLSRADRDTLIISAEDLSSVDEDGKKELIDFLQGHVQDIVVVAFIRSPSSFAASAFQQIVQEGQKTFPQTITTNYRLRIEGYAKRLPKESLIIRAYDPRSFPNGSVVQEFFVLFDLRMEGLTEQSVNQSLSAPALKLIYEYNRKNPCFTGDEALVRARFRLIDAINELYCEFEKIDKNLFANRIDRSDLPYLQDRWNIDLDGEHEMDGHASGDVEEWVCDMKDVDLTPLRNKIRSLGISVTDQGSEWLTSRLYYHYLGELNSKSVRTNSIKDAEINILRDVALKFESAQTLDQEEALSLMKIAARHRPNGPLIVRKIEEWSK